MKPFMVNQLAIAFERERMILSPFDEVLHKQLIDYSVERVSQSGQPIFSSENEHFVDALGLAYLAMVLEFKELTNMMKEPETANKMVHSNSTITAHGLNSVLNDLSNNKALNYDNLKIPKIDTDDRRGDRPSQFKVNQSYRKNNCYSNWGSRNFGRGGSFGRNSW